MSSDSSTANVNISRLLTALRFKPLSGQEILHFETSISFEGEHVTGLGWTGGRGSHAYEWRQVSMLPICHAIGRADKLQDFGRTHRLSMGCAFCLHDL